MNSQSPDNFDDGDSNNNNNNDQKNVEQNSRLIKCIMDSFSGKTSSRCSIGGTNSDSNKDGNNSDSNGGNNSDNSGLVSIGNSLGFNFDEGMSSNSKEGQNDSNDDSDEIDGTGRNTKVPSCSASLTSISKKKKINNTIKPSDGSDNTLSNKVTNNATTSTASSVPMPLTSTSMPLSSNQAVSAPSGIENDAAADIAVANLQSIVKTYMETTNNLMSAGATSPLKPSGGGGSTEVQYESETIATTSLPKNGSRNMSMMIAEQQENLRKRRSLSSNNNDNSNRCSAADDADSGGYNTDDDDAEFDDHNHQAPSPKSLQTNNKNVGKSSSKGGAATSTTTSKKKRPDSNKRQERNQREKERSLRIAKQIGELRTLLSSGGVVVPKGTKSSVLTEAANYIRMLQQHQYRSEIDRHQLVQQMQLIGSGAHGPQAAAAIRHAAAKNGVWSLGNFGGVPPKSAMTFYGPEISTESAQQKPQHDEPLSPFNQSKVIDPNEYRFVFNACGAGMAITSMGGAFIDCNQLFCQLSNYTKQEICSLTIFNLTARQDLQNAFDQISQLISPPMDDSGVRLNKDKPKPVVIRGAMKYRDDLGLSVALIKGDDGVAKCFCVTLVKNPVSPFDTSKPVPVSFDSILPQKNISMNSSTRTPTFTSG